MDTELIKSIAFAGIVHDIGKFAERTGHYEKGDPDVIKKKYRWDHPFHTAQILADIFPRCVETIVGDESVGSSSLQDLAARHHLPGNKLQKIMQRADWFAAGHERKRSDQEARLYKMSGHETKSQQPLISILSRICLPEEKHENNSEDMYCRIRVPSLAREDFTEKVHPCPGRMYPAANVREDYKEHWHSFVGEFLQQDGDKCSLDPLVHFETILEICRLYQCCLPETTRRQDLSDVSLFEHQKATAAIACCIYIYHSSIGDQITYRAIMDTTPEKFVLFCGDISGIQQFVYQISSKGAYKMLKGRSFFIQLLAEILARKYIEKFNLTSANILYCNGGKFYLLLPNIESVKQLLEELTDDINSELFDLYNGDIYLRTGFEKLSGKDLTQQTDRTLSVVWDDLGHQVSIQDRKRYAGLASKNYERFFGADPYGQTYSCDVCHCSMISKNNNHDGDNKSCQTCLDMKNIGEKLRTAQYIVMADDSSTVKGDRPALKIFNKYLWFCKKTPTVTQKCFIWTLNSQTFIKFVKSHPLSLQINAAPFVVGGNHTFDKDEPALQFDDIARRTTEGVHKLGILRMDVDNLGKIFRQGLNNYRYGKPDSDTRFHSMGRLATLSGQLACFFGSLVPQCIDSSSHWKTKNTVVYAGGDDLFILGTWDTIPEIALEIKQQFSKYCCHNPVFSMSGGMIITGGKFPIYKSAEMAGETELLSKNHQRKFHNNSETVKASFTFFDTPMHWNEFLAVKELKDELYPSFKNKEYRPLLRRILDVHSSWSESKRRLIRNNQSQSLTSIRLELEAEKWRWRMVYSFARFGENHQELRGTIKNLQRFILSPVAGSDRNGIELLGVLGKWCELQLRTPMEMRGDKSNAK